MTGDHTLLRQMSPSELLKIFEERGVIRRGHFLLSSGLHSDLYFEKFRVIEDPAFLEDLIASRITELRGLEPDVVVGPTTGGAIIAFLIARLLGVKAFFAEKEEGGERSFRRGFSLDKGARVLVVDDVLTTGGSIRATLKAVREKKWKPVGVFVLIDRSGDVDFGLPLKRVDLLPAETWRASECPLCKKGVPLEKPGGK